MQKRQNKKSEVSRSTRSTPAYRVRIIGGQWKRTPLAVLEAEGLRPTPDRVRETVFNWLTHLLNDRWDNLVCLDLFAGTGALGFEAASRGAKQVVMVENNGMVLRQLHGTKEKLQAARVNIVYGDALSTVHGLAGRMGNPESRFDVIFLDPPYHQEWLAKLLPLCEHLLTEGGVVYAEAERALNNEMPVDWLKGWDVVRADKAGKVFYHLLRRNKRS
jgi:16S rRNA (guanine966-N2)-methyltransferase